MVQEQDACPFLSFEASQDMKKETLVLKIRKEIILHRGGETADTEDMCTRKERRLHLVKVL